jgi:hypothetical protein
MDGITRGRKKPQKFRFFSSLEIPRASSHSMVQYAWHRLSLVAHRCPLEFILHAVGPPVVHEQLWAFVHELIESCESSACKIVNATGNGRNGHL